MIMTTMLYYTVYSTHVCDGNIPATHQSNEFVIHVVIVRFERIGNVGDDDRYCCCYCQCLPLFTKISSTIAFSIVRYLITIM